MPEQCQTRCRSSVRHLDTLAIHLAGEGIGGIEPDEVEIGWAIEDAFAGLPAPHLVAYIRPENTASLHIAAKLGMRDDGEGTTKSGDRMRIFRLPRPTTIEPA